MKKNAPKILAVVLLSLVAVLMIVAGSGSLTEIFKPTPNNNDDVPTVDAVVEVFFIADEDVGDGSDLVERLPEFRFAALPEGGAMVEVEAHENAVLLRVGGELEAALGGLGAHRCDKAGQMQHLHAVLAEELGGVVILRVERPAHFTGAVVPHARSAKPEAGIGDVELVAVSPGSALRHVRPDVGDVARAQLRFDIHEENSRAVAMLRDLFNPSYEAIYVNDDNAYNEIRNYVALIAPDRAHVVKHYTGTLPLMDNFGVTKQIKSSFGRIVPYRGGAYMVIEHTEALHVVDVNSGNRSRGNTNQEENAIDVNLGAADELARQLRLRDMGGIIVVDFIDMDTAENRQKLYERMCQNMSRDRAKHNILPLSKFGLMQITRQRVRPAMDVAVEESCPVCFGKGTIKASILFTDTLESKIDYLVNKLKISRFNLHIHPYVAAYVNQGLISLAMRWKMKYGFGIRITPNQSIPLLAYSFYDTKGNEIDMKEEVEMK